MCVYYHKIQDNKVVALLVKKGRLFKKSNVVVGLSLFVSVSNWLFCHSVRTKRQKTGSRVLKRQTS